MVFPFVLGGGRPPLLTLLIMTLLAACTPTAPDRSPEAYTSEQKVAEARALLAAANRSTDRERDELLLEAGLLFHDAGHRPSALHTLGAVNAAQLEDRNYVRHTLTYADLALMGGDRATARSLLTARRINAQSNHLPRPDRIRWHTLNARLYNAPNESLLALRHLGELSRLIGDRDQRQSAHDQLWTTLSHLSESELLQLSFEGSDSTLASWADLASALQAGGDSIDAQQQVFTRWQQRHPGHPASLLPPTALRELERFAREMPQQVALLLPLSGSLGDLGRAVRDGFLAAHFQTLTQSGAPPRVHLYDSAGGNDASNDITALYRQAIRDGAEMVVGPLQKQELIRLAREPELPIPLLGLNQIDAEEGLVLHENLFQFGLPPEGEARQVADRAWRDDHRTALILAPDTSWGQRAAQAFSDRWRELGGTLIIAEPYANHLGDYSDVVRPALRIEDSVERHARLERLLGQPLRFTPSRRPDIDMILLLAQPTQARQIKPTLDFFFAGDLPIYATSQIYDGAVERSRNQDLSGIRFTVEPLNLAGAIPSALHPHQSLPRSQWSLYGLGTDAFHLQQRLKQLQRNSHLSLPGSSGTLRVETDGTVSRELPWAEFRNGLAQPLRAPET